MLALISDIHLSDETTSFNVHPEALKSVLLEEIKTSARSKGARELHLALLGDIVDFVRTDYWLKLPPEARPWNGELDKFGVNKACDPEHYHTLLNEILTGTKSATSRALKLLCQGLSDLRVGDTTLQPKIIYVVGNHDRAFLYDPSLQRRFLDFIGMDVTFTHVLYAPAYALLARHGHQWDEHCYGYHYYRKISHAAKQLDFLDLACHKVQTIGEVITAELMGGLVFRVRNGMKRGNTAGLTQKIMQVNCVRPDIEALRWLAWGGSEFNDADKKLVMTALKESIQAVLNSSLARKWDKIKTDTLVSGDLTDRLSLLSTLLGKDYDRLEKLVPPLADWYARLSTDADQYVQGAERDLQKSAAQYVVYGHTHVSKQACFSAQTEGSVKMYYNTGTFLPLIQHAVRDGFHTDYQMTLMFFYRGDEDTDSKQGNSVSCEMWSGRKRKRYRVF